MGVERSGPQGYEFQYMVSLFFSLDNFEREELELYVEKDGGEDAELSYLDNGQKKVFDIQVKRYSAQLELDEYSKWISHFSDEVSDINLITKLRDDDNRRVIFVTNARSKDAVSIFVKDFKNLYESKDIPINNVSINDIKNQIIESYSDTSDLCKKRKEFCKQLLSAMKVEEIKRVLRKMSVWERCSKDGLENIIRNLLNIKFYVPNSLTKDVLLKLLEEIRAARDTRENVIPVINKILNLYNGNKVFTDNGNDIDRIENNKLEEILDTKGILLLTGVSLCGKTYTARKIAQRFQDRGYYIKITDELIGENGAITFLNHVSTEDRLCILDDPFGHSNLLADAVNRLTYISRLVRDLKLNRKLIVTSRIDLLLKVSGNKGLKKCDINGHNWNELTLEDKNTFKELWMKYFGNDENSINLLDRILEYTNKSEGSKLLQAGQIAYLATQIQISDLIKYPVEKIVHMSRVDSRELALDLGQRGNVCKELLILLGIGANTIIPLQLNDLGFILNYEKDYPGLYKKKKGIGISIGGHKHREPKFPKYKPFCEIEEKYKVELQYLEQHRYIAIDRLSKRVIFQHPIYHEICKYIFKEEITNIFSYEKCIHFLCKGLSALNKEVALNTIKFIDEIYVEIEDEETKKLIRDTIFKALCSIFPSVKDRVVSFFDNRFYELAKEQQQEFIDSIENEESMDNGDILWNGNEPWYNTSSERSYSSTLSFLNITNYNNAELIKGMFFSDEYVEPKDAWNYIASRNILEISIENENILTKMLNFSEVFIREEAMHLLFKNFAFNYDKDEIQKLLNIDEHPRVKLKLLSGALESWSKYNQYSKSIIVEFIKVSLMKLSLAIVMNRFLTDFEDEFGFGYSEVEKYSELQKKEMWDAWHELIIVFLNIFPSEFSRINTPHLSNIIEKSLKYISETKKIVAIAEAWFNWLNKTSQFRLTDDYANSVPAYLFEGTKKVFTERENLVSKLLEVSKTTYITTNVMYFINYWNCLSQTEKHKVIKLLKGSRPDSKWIKAVVLTRSKVPKKIQKELLGDNSILSKPAEEIIDNFDVQLLKSCLHVYCGYPQPLWYNGYHHSNGKLWVNIIQQVLLKKHDICFEVALRELVSNLILDGNREFKDGYLVWDTLCKSNSEIREKLFSRLLIETICTNSANKVELWDKLLKYSSCEEKDKFISTLVVVIEGVEYHHHEPKEIFEIFNRKFFSNELLSRLPSDKKLISMCDGIFRINEIFKQIEDSILDEKVQKLYTAFIYNVNIIYENTPPRLYFTNGVVLHAIEQLNNNNNVEELRKIIEKNRLSINDKGYKLLKKYNDEYEIEDWIF